MGDARKLVVIGLILAAGQSKRMGAENKLLKVWRDKPLVQHVSDAAAASDLEDVLVVTGHEADHVEAMLPNRKTVHNPSFEQGMGTSLACGVRHIVENDAPDGIMVLLGDMPLVEPNAINALLNAFDGGVNQIISAAHNDKRGNPVLFGSGWFEQLTALNSDQGARELLKNNPDVRSIEIGEAGRLDFDTPDAFTATPSSSA